MQNQKAIMLPHHSGNPWDVMSRYDNDRKWKLTITTIPIREGTCLLRKEGRLELLFINLFDYRFTHYILNITHC